MSAVDYTIDGQTYEGYFLTPAGKPDAPLVVICHNWAGVGENEKQKARIIAEEFGYAAFAIDVYGQGKRGTLSRRIAAPHSASWAIMSGIFATR